MKKSTVCSYLGDILCTSGSVDATIENRRQKGIGICSQISGMVNGLSLGHYYFNIAFLFREVMLLNGMLTNLEVWHPVTNKQIEVLENIDLMLLRKIIKGHSKTPKEAFFLETGLLPIKFVAIKRRLMYLHTILSKPETELIRKVYEVQKSLPTSKDWYEIVSDDRKNLEINLSDKEISGMKKEKFRIVVTKAVNEFALSCLNKAASKNENSKAKKLVKQELVREKYLKDKRFSKSECELLFALRTKMIPGIKKNFSSQYGNNLSCDLCFVQLDSQEHLLCCVKLCGKVNIPEGVEYNDIFKGVDKQLRIIKIFMQLLCT